MRYRGPATAFLNRAADGSFQLPADGWYHLVPKGRFKHPSGKDQVLDERALAAMVNRFERDAQAENFPGLLVDYDHFSQSAEHSSEAAGWVMKLANRDNGIWGQVKWTPAGEQALKDGRYRFISPVWDLADTEKLSNREVRPVRLDSLGLTNDPNLKGMVPLSNRQQAESKEETSMKNINTELGLSPDAAEDAAVAEIKKLKNRATNADTLTEENKTLKEQNKELLDAQVESDLEKFSNRFKPEARDKWKKQLLANRAGTLELLEWLEEAPAAGSGAAAATEGGQRMLNRKDGKQPQGDDKARIAEQARATKINNRAQQLAREQGIGFSQAWKQAQGENPA